LTVVTVYSVILPNLQGTVLQRGINSDGGDTVWEPTHQRSAYNFDQSMQNGLQIQTVNDVSEVWMVDHHLFCSKGCTYLGTAESEIKSVSELWNVGTSDYVSGKFIGTLTDPQGVHNNVESVVYFWTYPATDGVLFPGPGGFIAEITPN